MTYAIKEERPVYLSESIKLTIIAKLHKKFYLNNNNNDDDSKISCKLQVPSNYLAYHYFTVVRS